MTIRPIGIDLIQDHSTLQTISIDGLEIQQLESQYKGREDIDEDGWNTIVTTASRVLTRCPKPDGPNLAVTGLALGKVQSGKTLSYTALIALAVDNGYRITVVLAGTKNALLEQTTARLAHDLDAQRLMITPFKNPSRNDTDVLQSILHSRRHALLIALKIPRHIDPISQLLNNSELRHFPVLIIDDEGDEASLNTQFRRGSQSSTYRSILNLRSVLPHHAYIAYTATPQANLLISGLDALAPDFAELIEPGEGYCGGSTFFGEHSYRYLREIDLLPGSEEHPGLINTDLRFALATFFVGAAIRALRGDNSFHSMLLHTSKLKVDHVRLQQAVNQQLTLWKNTSSSADDPSNVSFYQLMRQAYEDLGGTVVTLPPWVAVHDMIMGEIWQTEVWIVNSLPVGRDPISSPFRLKNNIFIGGNMLGRGLTLKGLAVTYITREAHNETNADTLEQRARWFGYKMDYLDVCRIFLTHTLAQRYTELLRHEDDFWGALRRNQSQGLPVRDWPRLFRLDVDTWRLRPTRPQVASFRKFLGEGWYTQRNIILDPNIAKGNIETVRRFFTNKEQEELNFGSAHHFLYRDLSTDTIISDLLARLNIDERYWEKSYLVEYLSRLYIENRLRSLNVLFMNNGEFRNRSSDPEGSIGSINPMQGSNAQPGAPNYYPGDLHIHNDQVQLQVHLIRYHETTSSPTRVDTTALALYIPNDPIYDLRAIVRGDII